MLRTNSDYLLRAVLRAAQHHYGARLVTLAVFGSVARRTQRPDSDVDLLLICDPLPRGRMRRMKEFAQVEDQLKSAIVFLKKKGISTCLSPILKTPEEVRRGSALFLDLVEDARLLFDRDNFFRVISIICGNASPTRCTSRRTWQRMVLGPETRLQARRCL